MTAALWAVGLSPAFFAVVVWGDARSATGEPALWGETKVQAVPDAWRLYAGTLYGLVTIGLLLWVVVCSWAGPRPRASRLGTALSLAALAVYAGPVLSGVFGGHGGVGDWRLWLAPLAIVALHAAPAYSSDDLLRLFRMILRVYTWGSLGVMAIAPDWALAVSHIVNFRLPGVGSHRLIGLANHPILLGVLATAALAVEVAPLLRTRLWAAHAAAAAAVLLLAQSRTAWMAALAGLPFLYRRSVAHRVHPLVMRGLVLAFAACAALLVPATTKLLTATWSDSEITSLHGRTMVWDVALDAFHTNTLWGYGPTLFTDPASPAHGAFEHAHSQLYQTLGTSGLVGLVGLVLFVATLLFAALRCARASAGLTVALAAIVLVFCVSEAPLRGVGFSPYLLLVVLVSALVLSADSKEADGHVAHPPCSLPRPAAYGRSVRSLSNSSDAAGCRSTTR